MATVSDIQALFDDVLLQAQNYASSARGEVLAVQDFVNLLEVEELSQFAIPAVAELEELKTDVTNARIDIAAAKEVLAVAVAEANEALVEIGTQLTTFLDEVLELRVDFSDENQQLTLLRGELNSFNNDIDNLIDDYDDALDDYKNIDNNIANNEINRRFQLIWARARLLAQENLDQTQAQMFDDFAARGFTMPTGPLAGMYRQNVVDKEKRLQELLLAQAAAEVENQRKNVEFIARIRLDGLKTLAEIKTRLAEFYIGRRIDVVQLQVTIKQANIQLYATIAQIYGQYASIIADIQKAKIDAAAEGLRASAALISALAPLYSTLLQSLNLTITATLETNKLNSVNVVENNRVAIEKTRLQVEGALRGAQEYGELARAGFSALSSVNVLEGTIEA